MEMENNIKKMECYNGGNKHNFKARYEEQNRPITINVGNMNADFTDELHRLTTLKIYVHDICTWCGKIINRK